MAWSVFRWMMGGAAPGYDNFISSFSIADGNFHHVAVTVNRGSATGGKIYVDNLAPFTFNPTVRPGSLDSAAELRIGRFSTPNQDSLDFFFKGCIDELEIFNRALTADGSQRHSQCGQRGQMQTVLRRAACGPGQLVSGPTPMILPDRTTARCRMGRHSQRARSDSFQFGRRR